MTTTTTSIAARAASICAEHTFAADVYKTLIAAGNAVGLVQDFVMAVYDDNGWDADADNSYANIEDAVADFENYVDAMDEEIRARLEVVS